MAANFLHSTDLGSDTDDEDYLPEGEEEKHKLLSEEEQSGDNEEEDAKGSKKKKKKAKGGPGRSGGIFSLVNDEEEKRKEEERKKEFESEKVELKEEEEKKKIDDLWADFKKDTSSQSTKPKPSGSGLGGLSCLGGVTAKKVPLAGSSKSPAPPRSIMSSIFDSIPTSSATEKVEEKQIEKPKSIMSSIFDSFESSKHSSGETKNTNEEKKSGNQQQTEQDGKLKITRVFDFAGENVEITKEVDKDSKEAKKFVKDKEEAEKMKPDSSTGTKRPGGGLASIMNVISGKKTKMGCLDKSKLDWDSFVEKEGIKEELSTFNKGKEGFVEKQAFLERADHRRFEIEKEAREKTRKTFNR